MHKLLSSTKSCTKLHLAKELTRVNFCLLARHFANANHCLVTTIVNNNQVPRAVLDIISLALYGRASCYGSSL